MKGWPSTLLLFYKRHLRVQPVRELMAVVGVAGGVALLFAVQVEHRSITGSFQALTHGLAGRASVELAARGPAGFPQRIAEEVEAMPDVQALAPVFSQPIVAVGPRARRALTLLGANEQIAELGGSISLRFQRAGESSRRGLLVLSEPVARAIGVRPGGELTVLTGAHSVHLAVDALVPRAQVGEAAAGLLAAAPLPIVQSLAGEPERITRLLIAPRPGRQAAVLRALNGRYGATLDARSIDTEARLLGAIAAPEDDITLLFGAISVLAGMILAYNALLLASDERRRFIAQLVQTGTPDALILASLMFDALILGLAGCILGLLAGDGISLLAYRGAPGYIGATFPIGSGRVIDVGTVLLATCAGLLAALAAAGLPALAILRSGQADPGAGSRALSFTRPPRRADRLVCGLGALLGCVSIAVSLIWPSVTIAAVVGLAAGLVLCLPTIARWLLACASRLCSRTGDPCAAVAVAEVRCAPTRAVALLATGTVATFLLVLIGGLVTDVRTAVHRGATDLFTSAELWIRPGGQENLYSTQPFSYAPAQRQLERLPAVRSVQIWRDSLLDLPGRNPSSPGRRVWVLGAPPQLLRPLAPSQLLHGSLQTTDRRLHEGGWAAVSETVVTEHHLRLGKPFTLPTPTGYTTLRLAATLANYGSMQGAIIMSGVQNAHLWNDANTATELAVTLQPGTSTTADMRAIRTALARTSPGLNIATAGERNTEAQTVLASSLSRLNDTTAVVLIATIASVIALMLAAISARRARLDSLIAIGMSATQLARLVFYESALVLSAGCLIGTLAGLAGQYLVDGWLRYTTGSAVHYAPAWQTGVQTTAIIIAIALLTSLLAAIRTATTALQANLAFTTE